jgi:hypothetical protein
LSHHVHSGFRGRCTRREFEEERDLAGDRTRQLPLFTPAPQFVPFAPPPAVALPAGQTELANVLSPTQVRTFLGCSARWWFKYGLSLPEPKISALALGCAVHRALEANFRERIETKEDLEVCGVVGLFRAAWQEQMDQTEFRDDEDPAEIGSVGEHLVAKYMDEAAPSIEPAAVELDVAGTVGGVHVRGKVDLLDVHGRVVDVKTAASKPSGIAPDYAFQLATYRQITLGASGVLLTNALPHPCYMGMKKRARTLDFSAYERWDRCRVLTVSLIHLVEKLEFSEVYRPPTSRCSRQKLAFEPLDAVLQTHPAISCMSRSNSCFAASVISLIGSPDTYDPLGTPAQRTREVLKRWKRRWKEEGSTFLKGAQGPAPPLAGIQEAILGDNHLASTMQDMKSLYYIAGRKMFELGAMDGTYPAVGRLLGDQGGIWAASGQGARSR